MNCNNIMCKSIPFETRTFQNKVESITAGTKLLGSVQISQLLGMVFRIGLPIGATLACNQMGSRDIKDKKHATYEGGKKKSFS